MADLRTLPVDLALDDPARLRKQLLDWLLPPPSPALIAHATLALVFMVLWGEAIVREALMAQYGRLRTRRPACAKPARSLEAMESSKRCAMATRDGR